MKFKSTEEVISYIKVHKNLSKEQIKKRSIYKELRALVVGDGFKDELINRIEHIESKEKQIARKKYSRDIVDFYERLLNPTSNVFAATGGNKSYNLDNPDNIKKLLGKVSNMRGGKSIEKFVEEKWMPLYHVDPNGVIFMEYKEPDNVKNLIPTYKSSDSIRHYTHRGQLLDSILFEAQDVEIKGQKAKLWRLVDDSMDYLVAEFNSDTYIVIDELTAIKFIDKGVTLEKKSFEHPFGEVPGLIISDIMKINEDIRLPPIQSVIELSKEYARDQSVKTIYKFLNGFPIFWKYVAFCRTCHGTGKSGDSSCGECSGKGFYTKKDVTDVVNIPTPKKDDPQLAPNIAGYISPDLDTWKRFNEELADFETLAERTLWGTFKVKGKAETATARFIDTQPVINKLTKYSSVAEFVERMITEWTANFMFPNKNKEERISEVNYGRRYIIEPPDVILDKYEEAKEKGDNYTILDRLLNEYITAKYKTDPEWLRKELIKIEIEPFVHLSIEQVNTIYGQEAAQSKGLFDKWWGTLDKADLLQDSNKLEEEFNKWLNNIKQKNASS